MLRFALCADDYALTPGVSRGILELLAAGRLTAVSAMTTQDEWRTGAGELANFTGSADIGLHLNLTLGSPLSRMPAFAPTGRFPGLGLLVRSALLGRLPLPELATEIGRQLDAFADHFGRWPDYLDGHQHIHVLPGIRTLVFRALVERGLSGRLWLRDPGDRLNAILARNMRRKALVIAGLGAGFGAQARARGFDHNQGFSGFSDFNPASDYAAVFAASLRSLGPKHLIMCHPGYSGDKLARLDAATASREAELAFLRSSLFDELLARESAELAQLSQLNLSSLRPV